MIGVDPDIGSSAVRLWVAAGSAALLVFLCALAFDWTRTRTAARFGAVVVGAGVGAVLAWLFLDAAAVRDLGAERRALELRATELGATALAPGSPLACLDAMAGEGVEAACEKAIFATPATVASATSYVTARLALLAGMVAYSRRGGADIDGELLPLRRAIEADRYGFVAHTLALRDGCSSQSCKAFTLLRDPARVRANLSGQTLDRYLDHYTAVWAQAPDVPVADAGATQTAAIGLPGAPNPRRVPVDIDFPSAASIPAVSIMNPEPKGPVVPGAAAAAAAAGASGAEQNPAAANPASTKRSRKQASNPAPPPAAAPSFAAPADPVWAPGAVSAPQPATTGAVQLNAFPAPPQASASGPAHTP